MDYHTRWAAAGPVIAVVIAAGVSAAGCSNQPGAGSPASTTENSKVEPVPGSNLSKVTLSAQAANRLGVQTMLVRETAVADVARKVVPYSAVLYDPTGKAYVYRNPTPLVYLRAPIDVDSVDGELAVLNDGPPAGTAVVTVGAAELFGTEFEGRGE